MVTWVRSGSRGGGRCGGGGGGRRGRSGRRWGGSGAFGAEAGGDVTGADVTGVDVTGLSANQERFAAAGALLLRFACIETRTKRGDEIETFILIIIIFLET